MTLHTTLNQVKTKSFVWCSRWKGSHQFFSCNNHVNWIELKECKNMLLIYWISLQYKILI